MNQHQTGTAQPWAIEYSPVIQGTQWETVLNNFVNAAAFIKRPGWSVDPGPTWLPEDFYYGQNETTPFNNNAFRVHSDMPEQYLPYHPLWNDDELRPGLYVTLGAGIGVPEDPGTTEERAGHPWHFVITLDDSLLGQGASAVYDVFVRQLAHVMIRLLEKRWGVNDTRAALCGLLVNRNSRTSWAEHGAGTSTGSPTPAQWEAGTWRQRVKEAVAETFKDVALTEDAAQSNNLFDNRTDWVLPEAKWADWREWMHRRPRARVRYHSHEWMQPGSIGNFNYPPGGQVSNIIGTGRGQVRKSQPGLYDFIEATLTLPHLPLSPYVDPPQDASPPSLPLRWDWTFEAPGGGDSPYPPGSGWTESGGFTYRIPGVDPGDDGYQGFGLDRYPEIEMSCQLYSGSQRANNNTTSPVPAPIGDPVVRKFTTNPRRIDPGDSQYDSTFEWHPSPVFEVTFPAPDVSDYDGSNSKSVRIDMKIWNMPTALMRWDRSTPKWIFEWDPQFPLLEASPYVPFDGENVEWYLFPMHWQLNLPQLDFGYVEERGYWQDPTEYPYPIIEGEEPPVQEPPLAGDVNAIAATVKREARRATRKLIG